MNTINIKQWYRTNLISDLLSCCHSNPEWSQSLQQQSQLFFFYLLNGSTGHKIDHKEMQNNLKGKQNDYKETKWTTKTSTKIHKITRDVKWPHRVKKGLQRDANLQNRCEKQLKMRCKMTIETQNNHTGMWNLSPVLKGMSVLWGPLSHSWSTSSTHRHMNKVGSQTSLSPWR